MASFDLEFTQNEHGWGPTVRYVFEHHFIPPLLNPILLQPNSTTNQTHTENPGPVQGPPFRPLRQVRQMRSNG